MPLTRPTTTWRDWYNPLAGLTVARIVGMEAASDRGQFSDLQWFWHHMERTDVTVQAAISRRLSFVASGDWEIRINENADATLAAEQADLLRYAYNRIANFKDATLFLASALFRGYAHLEKIGTGYGNLVSRLEPIPQWFWVREGMNGRWRLNQDSKSQESRGEMVLRDDLCILESSALNRAIARHFFAKQLAFADWDQALELGANQSIFFVEPPGTTPEMHLEYQNTAERLASNGRGSLPHGADVKMIDPGSRSKLPYAERIRYPKQTPQTGDGHQIEPPSAPVDPTQAILDKIERLRRGLPPDAPLPPKSPLAAQPPAGTITIGRPSGPVPTSIPIPPRHPAPAPTPGHPDPNHPGQTPPIVVVPKKAKKSYVKNWYRGATTP